ncbi:MAG: twin-arginine translocase subunit TatC [Myxococcota bacterium]
MDDVPRPLIEHLDELRRRLFWALGSWALCAAVAGYWVKDVFRILTGPAVDALLERDYTLVALAPPELFFTYVKSALLTGFLVSLPMILYQAWAFVSPGLYRQERRFALPFVVCTTLLFLAGATFGYFVAFPFVFQYFLSLESEVIRTSWSVQTVFSFMARLYLAFGTAFQLPIVLFFLSLAGIITPTLLSRWRKYAIVIIFAASAIITPPDVVSQVMLALPLWALYEIGLLVSRLVVRRRARLAEPTGQ